MARENVFSFIKRHWIAYLIGAVIAVLLGLGVSYFLGVKWSTPEEVRAERLADKQASDDSSSSDADLSSSSSE